MKSLGGGVSPILSFGVWIGHRLLQAPRYISYRGQSKIEILTKKIQTPTWRTPEIIIGKTPVLQNSVQIHHKPYKSPYYSLLSA